MDIASTMLITLLNRTMSSSYDDKMQVKFVPGEEYDQKKVNSMNILAQNDYREMEKDRLDYDWLWDTLFFGRGYVETGNFDKKRKILVPEVINPLVMGYDPYFEEKEDWRYYWKWLAKSRVDIINLIKARKLNISDPDDIPSGMESFLWNYKIRRDQARKTLATASDSMGNDIFQILEFYGYDENQDRCCFWTDKSFSKIIYKEKLDFKDGDDGKSSKWPLVIKEAFRVPHSSVPFSVADLLDDKHRAKSVLMNLAFLAAKDKANPIYGYNPDKVKDVTQLMNRQISQHIPMDGPEAVWPLTTENPMDPGMVAFIQFLSQEASDPLGTGMQMNPGRKGHSTATGAAIEQQLNDMALSLQSKVMQFGEKEFWMDWFHRYQRFTKEGDEKIATIVGVKGLTFEKIKMGDIHTSFPPGVLIYSAKEAEYKRTVLRQDYMQILPILATSLPPEGMRNFYKYNFFPLTVDDPTTIENLFPKTIDEIKAEGENDMLANNKLAQVSDTDDHAQHLIIHQMAQKTWATWMHMAWHEDLLGQQKKQEQMAQQMQTMSGGSQPGEPGVPGQMVPQTGTQMQKPMNAATPAQQNLQPENKQTSNMKNNLGSNYQLQGQ